MAKEIRIHLSANQKARLDLAGEKTPNESLDSSREKAPETDSSDPSRSNPEGSSRVRSTVFSLLP